MSSVTTRTPVAEVSFREAWCNPATGMVLAIVDIGAPDAHLGFNDPADARAVAAACIKAAEAMEQLTRIREDGGDRG